MELRFFLFLAPLLLVLAGCTRQIPSDDAALSGPTSPRTFVRDMAAAVVGARAFDRALLAARRGDVKALENADRDLRLADFARQGDQISRGTVGFILAQGFALDDNASREQGEKRRELRRKALEKFREALRLKPDYAPDNRDLLNALGYSLAVAGEDEADFRQAIRLTQRSVELWDEAIEKADERQKPLLRYNAAFSARDSLAWALFRAGRLEEARQTQQFALEEIAATKSAAQMPLSGDIPFHMAEILRALDENEEARRHYQDALKLQLDAETRAQIEATLKQLEKPKP